MAESAEKEKSKFSLIELLMIIMLVGIVFTLIIPMRIDRQNKEKLSEAIYNTQYIAKANVQFKAENDYYMFEHTVIKLNEDGSYGGDDLLNIADNLKKTNGDLIFNYALTDSTVEAITNSNFGKTGARIYYYLPNGPFGLADDKTSKNLFDPNWLP